MTNKYELYNYKMYILLTATYILHTGVPVKHGSINLRLSIGDYELLKLDDAYFI